MFGQAYFGTSYFGGSYWGKGSSAPPPITPATFARGIGDDAFHPGWDRTAWKKKQNREDALEATIRATYEGMTGVAPAPEVVAAIVVQAEAAPVFKSVDYSGLEEWIAAQRVVIAQIIARQDDEDDTEFLLLQ